MAAQKNDEPKSEATRAADDLVKALEGQITSGELAEGQPLPPERDIVQTYGVSRTVVREAVLMLANRGLIDAKPRFRPVVRKPSFDVAFDTVDSIVGRLLSEQGGIRNLFDTRIMIEVALARQAATEASKDDLAALKAALEQNKAAIDDSTLFYQTDIAFHAVLFEVPRNPVLPALHRAYTAWLEPQWSKMPRLAERNATNYRAHEAIFEGILMRDPDTAEHALRAHMCDAWDQVCITFQGF